MSRFKSARAVAAQSGLDPVAARANITILALLTAACISLLF